MALGLALRQPAVAADVAVQAARDDVDGVLVAGVAQQAHRRRVDAHDAPGRERDLLAVAELHRQRAAVHEVDLLLAVVVVPAGLGPGREHDALIPNAVTPIAPRIFRKPGPSPSSSRLVAAQPSPLCGPLIGPWWHVRSRRTAKRPASAGLCASRTGAPRLREDDDQDDDEQQRADADIHALSLCGVRRGTTPEAVRTFVWRSAQWSAT